MRAVVPLIALALTTGAAAESSSPAPPAETVVAPPGEQPFPPEGRIPCRDTIQLVRDERGLPRLQRETALPGEAVMIAAVDHRIDGCSVMVMYGNTSDVRPLPALPDGPPQVQRIPGR